MDVNVERRKLNEQMAREIHDIWKILNGNGKIGLVAKVEMMWWACGVMLVALTGAWIKIIFQ